MTLLHNKKTRVGIADNDKRFRKKTLGLIKQTNLEIVLEAVNGVDLLEKIKCNAPDIILIDMWMPQLGGIEAIEALQSEHPYVNVVTYAQYINEEDIIAVFGVGVKGLLRKVDVLSQFQNVIQVVSNGGTYLTEDVSKVIQSALRRLRNVQRDARQIQLSMLERKLLSHVCSGLSCTEIGDLLCKSPRTIEKYRADLYSKFGVSSKVQFIKRCLELGIV